MILLITLRICPGRRFALQTMYIVVASVLSTFQIEPVLGEDGNPQVPEPEFESLFVRYVFLGTSVRVMGTLTIARDYIRDPKPFKCTIKPRSTGAVKLVKEACDIANY